VEYGQWGPSYGWDKCQPRIKGAPCFRLHEWYIMELRLSFSLNLSCLEAGIQPGCLVLQLLEGPPFLLSYQEVFDCVLQPSIKVWGQHITIYLHMLTVAYECGWYSATNVVWRMLLRAATAFFSRFGSPNRACSVSTKASKEVSSWRGGLSQFRR